MSNIIYNKKSYSVDGTDSVLDTLQKQGVDFPFSCKIGTCQSCLAKLVDGCVPPESQKGLKPTLVVKKYFLTCQCKPTEDISIELPKQNDTDIYSKIVDLSMLNHNVLRVRVSIDKASDFKPGQYINLVASRHLVRSYSIANIPKDYIELHIKLMPNGLMSNWLTHQAEVGSSVSIRGPMGDCFYYNPENQSFPIVLAGTGTGVAPLIGIVNHVLKSKHDGKIILIHGGVHDADLYFHNELIMLQNKHTNFKYIPCVLNDSKLIQKASIENLLIQSFEGIVEKVRLFICGPEETTNKLKIKAFLAGVPSSFIYTDAFVTACFNS